MNVEILRAFFGWCTLLGAGLLILSTFALVLLRGPAVRLHQKWFGLEESELARIYFRYLATLKILILVFHLIPYLALRAMV